MSNTPDVPVNMAFEPFLYQSSAHLQTQSENGCLSFYLFRRNQPAAIACFHCFQDESGTCRAPARAPFGGIQCAPTCSAEDIVFFLKAIRHRLADRKVHSLIVKTAPACYHPELHGILHSCYLSAGFIVKEQHTNQHIQVGPFFEKLLHSSEKRRLRKCMSADFEIIKPGLLPVSLVYDFLHTCREQKGYSMSVTARHAEMLAKQLPGKFKTFGLKSNGRLVAAALTVQASGSVLYNFLSDYDSCYRQFSPAVLLTKLIHNYCMQQGIATLDLGISLDAAGNHKSSLDRFKRNLGGIASEKITYATCLR